MKIYCVRIGDKYGQQYEDYMNDKLSDYEVIWIKEPIKPNVPLQWNKMVAMNDDSDEPVVVLDIDKIFINDYKEALDYSIKPGEFLAAPYWWGNGKIPMSGGFYKFYPKDCKYIFDKFMSDPHHWQHYYIKNGTTKGPVNGEQYFVEDSVKENLELITLPDAWFTRWVTDESINYGKNMTKWQIELTNKYNDITGNDYIYLGGEFHEDIKFVHFTHSLNKPHLWEDYSIHV